MRRHKCPVCGGTISYWRTRIKHERSWRLQGQFRESQCPSCGTTLQWSIEKWQWAVNAVFLAMSVVFAWLLLSTDWRPVQQIQAAVYLSSAGAIVIGAIHLLAARPVAAEKQDGEAAPQSATNISVAGDGSQGSPPSVNIVDEQTSG